jgi:hypothetical protein
MARLADVTPSPVAPSRVSVLPEMDVVRVQRWCRGRVPEHVRDEVRVEVDAADRHMTIVECPGHTTLKINATYRCKSQGEPSRV